MPRSVSLASSALVHLCFVGFFASIIYFIYLARHSPGTPLTSTGQTVELNNHGSLFYVRFWEAVLAQSGWLFVATILVTTVLLRWRYGEMPVANDSRGLGLVMGALVLGTVIYMFWPIF
jgi:hypothetical protein